MNDQKVLEAYKIKSEDKNADIKGLGLNDQEILLLDEMLHGGQEVPTQPDPTLESIAQNPFGAAAIGMADKAGFELADEAYGAIKALFDPNDPRPFEERYREAQRQFAHASESAWQQNPKSYATGATAGLIGSGIGALKAGATGIKSALALGAATGAGSAPEGEALKGAVTGAITAPVVEYGAIPIAKGIGAGVNKVLGSTPELAWEHTKDLALGLNNNIRTKMRDYGSKIKDLNSIPRMREELKLRADAHAATINNIVKEHLNKTGEEINGVLGAVDEWYGSQGRKAASGKEVAGIVQKYFDDLARQRDWLSISDPEKMKFLTVLDNLKDRILFKTEKDTLRHASNLQGTSLDSAILNDIKELSGRVETGKPTLPGMDSLAPDSSKVSDFQDMSLLELNDLRKQLQDVTDKNKFHGLSQGVAVEQGGIISNPRTAKLIKNMEIEIRNLADARADEATRRLGIDYTWKTLRTKQHQNKIIEESLPNVSDMVSLANEGKLNSRTAELTTFMNAEPTNELHADLQSTWAKMKPDFEEFNTLALIDPNRPTSRGATTQFRVGAGMQGLKNSPANPIVQNYVIPRAAQSDLNPVKALVGYMGDQMGIPGAIASEEIDNAQKNGDNYSLEKALGEIAPKFENFAAPSPVLTSKGRARSAIVDGTGFRARIVDPLERNAIRDDVWNDDTMSTTEKMKKVDQLNKTEKIDLDKQEPGVSLGPTQIYNPQTQEPVNPQDVFGAMNER